MLFFPFNCEGTKIEGKDCKLIYNENVNLIQDNKKKYQVIDEDVLYEAIENVRNENEDIEDEEIVNFNSNK